MAFTLYSPTGQAKAFPTNRTAAQEAEKKRLLAAGWTLTSPKKTATSAPAPTLSGPLKDIFDQAKALLDELKKRGQVLNPNIELTPEKVAEFMKQIEVGKNPFTPYAEAEINPYYQNQLKLAREGFLTSLGYDKETILRNEANLERKYTQAFRGIGEQAAESGFAQSGVRQRQEQELGTDVQNQIDEGRRMFTNRADELSRAFAQTYGGGELKNLGLNISNAPKVGDGRFVRPSGETGLYSLSPDIYDQLVGSEEYNRRAAVRTRQSELESAFRSSQAAGQYRNLYI